MWLCDCGHREGLRHQSPSPPPQTSGSPLDETRRCPQLQPVSAATCALSAWVTQRTNAHLIFTINYASHNFSLTGGGWKTAPWEGWSGPLGHSCWGGAESSLLPLAGWWPRGHGRWLNGRISTPLLGDARLGQGGAQGGGRELRGVFQSDVEGGVLKVKRDHSKMGGSPLLPSHRPPFTRLLAMPVSVTRW